MVLVVLDVVSSLADLFSLFLLLLLVQHYLQPGAVHPKFFPAFFAAPAAVWPFVLLLALFGLKNLAGSAIGRAHFQLNSDVAVRISENNLVQYQLGSYADFVRVDSSEQVRRIAFQPFEFCQQLLSGLQQLITQVFLVGTTVAGILLFQPRLFLLLLCLFLPPVTALFYLVKKRLRKEREQIVRSNEASYRYLFDALKGYVEGNVFLRNDFFRRRFVAARRRFAGHLFATLHLQTLPGRLIEVVVVFGLLVLILLSRWTGNNASLLTIGAFMAAAYKIIPGMVRIINLGGQVRAYEFKAADYCPEDGAELHPGAGANRIHSIRLCNIGYQYNDRPAFRNVSLCLQRGEFVGIFGPSGRGKTTLFNLLLGFLSAQQGEILVNEEPVTAPHLKHFWPNIAYVRQQCFLLHDTVQRNITLSEETNDHQRLWQALKVAGLEEMIRQSGEGLEKLVAENGKNISGGQQQRIALARALYKDADVYLLDEPFNELDEASEEQLLHHFRMLAQNGKMVLMVTHNTRAAAYCTKTICLDEN